MRKTVKPQKKHSEPDHTFHRATILEDTLKQPLCSGKSEIGFLGNPQARKSRWSISPSVPTSPIVQLLNAKVGKIVHLAIKTWKSAYRHSLTSRSFWDVGPRWILPVVAMATDFVLFYHRFSIIPFSLLVLKWHHSNGYHQKENGILHLLALIRTFITSIVCNNGPTKWPLSKMYFLTWGDNFFS